MAPLAYTRIEIFGFVLCDAIVNVYDFAILCCSIRKRVVLFRFSETTISIHNATSSLTA